MTEVRTVRDIEIDIAWTQYEVDKMLEGDFFDRKRQKELKENIKKLFKERSEFKNKS
jgi:hypothetical protein